MINNLSSLSNFNKLILASFVLLVGILGSLVLKYFPPNIFGVLFLVFLGICRFGGLVLFIVYLVKFFSKEKSIIQTTEELEIVKRNKVLIFSIISLVFGVLFCFSTYFLPYLCDKNSNICSVNSVGLGLVFFVPMGIILICIGLLKLNRVFKKNRC